MALLTCPECGHHVSEYASCCADCGCPIDVIKSINERYHDFTVKDGILKKYLGNSSDVVVPEGVLAIGASAFADNTTLKSITLPDTVTQIDAKAFYKCSALESVIVPDSVTVIGVGTFAGCTLLTAVTLPASVASIQDAAFAQCNSLVLTVDEHNPSYCVVGNALLSKDGTTMHSYIGSANSTEYVIPDSVISISPGAFFGYDHLTSIIMPNSVVNIGENAFQGCLALTSVALSDSVISIGERVFASCESLTSITIPQSVTSIGKQAFAACKRLTTVSIPKSVTCIDDGAFFACESLTSMVFPPSVNRIGGGVFGKCTSLNNVILPQRFTIASSDNSAFTYIFDDDDRADLADYLGLPEGCGIYSEDDFKICEIEDEDDDDYAVDEIGSETNHLSLCLHQTLKKVRTSPDL